MGSIKKLSITFILMILCSFAFAQQVSFQIVQHDKSAESVTEKTFTIEDQLVEMFFENGYIVTNSPSVCSKSDQQDEKLWKTGLKDAVDGFSDYFIQINLYYTKDESNLRGAASLVNIDWALVYAKTGKTVKKQTVKSERTEDGSDDLYTVSSEIFKEIKKAIKA